MSFGLKLGFVALATIAPVLASITENTAHSVLNFSCIEETAFSAISWILESIVKYIDEPSFAFLVSSGVFGIL